MVPAAEFSDRAGATVRPIDRISTILPEQADDRISVAARVEALSLPPATLATFWGWTNHFVRVAVTPRRHCLPDRAESTGRAVVPTLAIGREAVPRSEDAPAGGINLGSEQASPTIRTSEIAGITTTSSAIVQVGRTLTTAST